MGVVYARDSSAARARARRATHARFAEFGVYIGAMTQFGLSSAGMLENELCPARNTSAVDQWAMCRSAASVVRAGCFRTRRTAAAGSGRAPRTWGPLVEWHPSHTSRPPNTACRGLSYYCT